MDYIKEYKRWLASVALTEEERAELISVAENDKDLKERFSSPLSFGTAGLRAEMKLGIGGMNRFTVAQATRGIAALIKARSAESRGVAIAYDSRNNSELYARVSASVLASLGIRVYIFDSIRPTPELSYAVIELSCIAGINVTASHNPKEYNGYKAYWEDGAQINPEQAKIVSLEREKYDVLDTLGTLDFEKYVDEGVITVLGTEFDEKYIDAVLKTSIDTAAVKELADDLKVVYTPLHGAGYKLVPEVLSRIGLQKLYTVDEQMKPDGNFPTLKKPNPEYKEAFTLGIALADSVGSDLIIATDPDADRVGVMARNSHGEFVNISGNQMGALLLDYVVKKKMELGLMPKQPYAVKSIVSTDMVNAIAKKWGFELVEVLTGFKFIGEVIKKKEEEGNVDGFLLGFEESYGYLLGSYARDKDAVGASMMILELTAYYKKLGMTLAEALDSLFLEYGVFAEKTDEIYMTGYDGIERRTRAMASMRSNTPKAFGNISVVSVLDYLNGTITYLGNNKTEKTNEPKSDILYYTLESGDKIIVRPSGTEPKIKIYALVHGNERDEIELKVKAYVKDARGILEQ